MRERQVLDALAQGGPVTSWEIMLRLYPDIDKRLRRAADNNVRSHLVQLEDEGRIAVTPGKPRRPSPAKQTRAVEHAKRIDTAIRQGKRYEAQRRRAEVRAQENPPSSEWVEPPRYALA
jgi:hypothetical protein